jgi:hypothetical protein
MARRVRGLPGATAELLLKAALLDGDIARESWQTWHERVAFDTIDYESQLLLPLLLDNLQRLGLATAASRGASGWTINCENARQSGFLSSSAKPISPSCC